ncbi:IDEAL domain-containing protein [Aeribacillus pallidus]|jgi:uncharacterized protein YpiB (UPF0302 family)|uniref:IDEAL domain-containing protein n=1 Tax=Aeribacillus pallidus TaxID=33936 RepID=UPI001E019017|nr:IDEAL domain-containing protein [Bacillus sp. (in: firmicutes)]
MKNEKSYTELMKSCAMTWNKDKERTVLDIYIDTLLYEVQLNREKERLLNEIDTSLDRYDKASFMHYSSQYIKLMECFG